MWMLLTAACFAVAPTVVTVSPTGPVRTLEAALAAVKGKPGARIVVRRGEYLLPATLEVGPEHAGLTIEAAKGERPVLVGGVPVSGWRQEGPLWVAPVPDSVAREGSRMLSVGGKMMPRSRWPETGELLHENVFDVPWMSTTGGGWKRPPTQEELTTLTFKPGDLGDWLDPASAEVTVFHMWDESCVGVAAIDLAARRLTFSSPTGHPPGGFGVNKYVVWNTRKGLTQPGQWFLDRRAKQVYYRPKPGEKPGSIRAQIGTLNVLLSVRGAAGVTVRGLDLRVSNVALKAGGFGAGDYDGALAATDSPNLKLEGLKVGPVAGTGIKTVNCADVAIVRCEVADTGACGIRAEGDRARVADNTVRRVGRMYPSAVGIWSSAKEARVEHNEVTDTPYTAVLGAGPGAVFEANHIARAMQVLHDGAGIYFGFTERVTLRGNLIEEIVDTGGYGASAYYLDEQAADCVVEGNVSLGIVRPSQNHMAKSNTIRRNLFVGDGDMRADFARCAGYSFLDNVLVAKGSLAFRRPVEGIAKLEGNWIDAPGGVQVFTLVDYGETASEKGARLPGNVVGPVRVKQVAKRWWRAEVPGQPARDWDLRKVGPRP